jgi:hypothetical protein
VHVGVVSGGAVSIGASGTASTTPESMPRSEPLSAATVSDGASNERVSEVSAGEASPCPESSASPEVESVVVESAAGAVSSTGPVSSLDEPQPISANETRTERTR